jgi:hypothetical protein
MNANPSFSHASVSTLVRSGGRIGLAAAAIVAILGGCSVEAGRGGVPDNGGATPGAPSSTESELSATIGAAGGELTGAKGSVFEGVRVVLPPGAIASDTLIRVKLAQVGGAPLPAAALACGKMFTLEPAGLALATPATVTLPFDEAMVTDHDRFDDEVKVWAKDGDKWGQRRQIESAEGTVTVELTSLTDVAPGVNPPQPADYVRFKLVPNPKFVKCLAAYPDDPSRTPRADVVVVRGELNDSLTLKAAYLKPGLKFDLFTVENSALTAAGTPDPAFKNFGMAWYQSDVDAYSDGRAKVNIRTILLDQIFGFDPVVNLAPTATLHVGFWFNDPKDAAPSGFDVTKPTPFNGDHEAGPLAMISLPDAATNLGPLCTNPDTSTVPAHCSP